MNLTQLSRFTVLSPLLILLLLCNLFVSLPQPVRAEAPAATLPSPVNIHFPDLVEARSAILDDRDDPYFSRLQPLEMAAKTGRPVTGTTLDEQQANCRALYAADVASFSSTDQETLTW